MKRNVSCKVAVDLLMTGLLLCLMAYQVTGQLLHEVFGAAMLALFLMHHILNRRWYGNLRKGRYTARRIISTVISFALLAAMLSLAYSGIVMSRYVFSFLGIQSGRALARTVHLAASYWGFVLMSIHLGLHWSMVTGMTRRVTGPVKQPARWLLRLIALGIAGYGLVCFLRAGILSYMFLRTEFAFFDDTKSAPVVFSEHIAMMGFCVFASYYLTKGLEYMLPGRKR